MKIAELCAWAGAAPDTPWEQLEAALREKTLAWAGEGATLVLALGVGMKSHAEAEARLSDAKAKKVPPMSPVWRMAEADCKKWTQRLEVAKVLVEVERFGEVRTRLEGLIKEGKRNQAKRELDKLDGFARGKPELFQEQWQDIEAAFLDAFGQVTLPPSPATPAPPPVPPQPSAPVTPVPPAAEDFEERMRVGDTVRELRPGRRVFGRYRLEKVIGRGGMGVVWLARDERLERPVALKFLPEIVRLDASAVKELKRETQRSLELTHPHIVRIYDYVEDAELAAISMEYVDGSTLTAIRAAKANDVLEVSELRGWVRQLGDALEYAHEQARVVHRDLKPANLMVNSRRVLKVADFGISRSLSESFSRVSMGSGSGGTPVYMSPQQALGEKPSVADDIYGFGATLYELLTGKPPFFRGDIWAQLKEKVPPLVSERRREFGIESEPILEEWDRAIAACLEKDAGKRPPSVRGLIERLEGRGGEVVSWKPEPAVAADSLDRLGRERAELEAKLKAAMVGKGEVEMAQKAAEDETAALRARLAEAEQEKEAHRRAKEDLEQKVRELAAKEQVHIELPVGVGKAPQAQKFGTLPQADALRQEASRGAKRAGPTLGERFTNGVGMAMIWVRPGGFEMGSPESEKDRHGDETRHRVRLSKGYWLGATEVTQAQWKAVMGRNPSYLKGSGRDAPVEQVTWKEAMEYCRELTERERGAGRLPEGYVYTLPTEAQWEYACRAGTVTRFSYGDDPSYAQLEEYAWYGKNSGRQTHPVGGKKPNGWGFYDMHGNVWEWCLDWYGPCSTTAVVDPKGPGSGSYRVIRGGGWYSGGRFCRSARRYDLTPEDRRYDIGFRAVLAPG